VLPARPLTTAGYLVAHQQAAVSLMPQWNAAPHCSHRAAPCPNRCASCEFVRVECKAFPLLRFNWRMGIAPRDCIFSLHISRRIRFSGEMWLNRLNDRRQSNSQTIAPDYFLSGDRSNCDGIFFLKVNRYNLSWCDDVQMPSCRVDAFRKYVEYATAFVKHAG